MTEHYENADCQIVGLTPSGKKKKTIMEVKCLDVQQVSGQNVHFSGLFFPQPKTLKRKKQFSRNGPLSGKLIVGLSKAGH